MLVRPRSDRRRYKELVPTTLVPAIEWHTASYDGTPGSGDLVWESRDILEALDEKFAAAPLKASDPVAEVAEVLNASFGFVYARNLTDDEVAAKRVTFETALDELDAILASGGPFVRGASLSAADWAVTKLHGAVKVHFLCAQRGARVLLNSSAKFW